MEKLVRPELQSLGAYRRPILRYLEAWKFHSLVSHRAVWFSRLGGLDDEFEGRMPTPTKHGLQAEHRKWESTFPVAEYGPQIREAADRNEQDGCAVLAVNCWFADAAESEQMWQRYGGSPKGVAIQSSCDRLVRGMAHQEYAQIGLVRYVDFDQEDMGPYLGNQAMERAFLKRPEFRAERELRIATMNLVAPGCLNPDGTPPSARQRSGPGMYDPTRLGFFVRADLATLIRSVRLAPGASESFASEVREAVGSAGLSFPIDRSALE